ncbi:sec-independent protein translocase protein TatB [Novosphingobium sp. Rr 2-17]|uniref:Sec-independent protein translocase protein TatB n=1 Tax=Novosphingobium sp. Rr 2-17 TaxID=555793 RepID=UPI000269918C|nr:Sec-independent protein translocase protein TatB [Novosphingobium sp. Rr 2-17]EIZ80990.1 sec-independent protein translocase protein TatB [Novosphingobium sp. Rr 2-17]
MFDIGASELLMIAIVAVVVIGPKDMPLAMRTAGRWIGKMRKVSGHFRAGLDAMVREAELEDMERKWREQNEAIMKANPMLPTAEPSVEDMQAPISHPALPPIEGQPALESGPASESGHAVEGVPVGEGAHQDSPSRQTELHLPPRSS